MQVWINNLKIGDEFWMPDLTDGTVSKYEVANSKVDEKIMNSRIPHILIRMIEPHYGTTSYLAVNGYVFTTRREAIESALDYLRTESNKTIDSLACIAEGLQRMKNRIEDLTHELEVCE